MNSLICPIECPCIEQSKQALGTMLESKLESIILSLAKRIDRLERADRAAGSRNSRVKRTADDSAWRRERLAAIKELNRIRSKYGLSYRKATEKMDRIDRWHVHFIARRRNGLTGYLSSFITYAKRCNARHRGAQP